MLLDAGRVDDLRGVLGEGRDELGAGGHGVVQGQRALVCALNGVSFCSLS